MGEELWFEVYGRFNLVLRPGADGWWLAYRHRQEGRREVVEELVIPMEASDIEILHSIEAAYHELARPGTNISRIDSAPS